MIDPNAMVKGSGNGNVIETPFVDMFACDKVYSYPAFISLSMK